MGEAGKEIGVEARDFITVVSGLPRSGTSMMMQMLAAGGMSALADDLRPPDPDNPRGYFEFEPAKRIRIDHAWVASALGRAVKLVHLLLPELPEGYRYRVLFMHRDIDEVLASQSAMLRRLGRRPAELDAKRLGEVFTGQVGRVREWLDRQPHVRTLHVNYRDVVAEPLPMAVRVNAFLGGILDALAMAAAVDPTLYRNRETSIGGATPPVAGA